VSSDLREPYTWSALRYGQQNSQHTSKTRTAVRTVDDNFHIPQIPTTAVSTLLLSQLKFQLETFALPVACHSFHGQSAPFTNPLQNITPTERYFKTLLLLLLLLLLQLSCHSVAVVLTLVQTKLKRINIHKGNNIHK